MTGVQQDKFYRYFITDGQFVVSTMPAIVHTILGSCISVCFWDKELHIGGMNHYLMPGSSLSPADNLNHGYSAIRMLLKSMMIHGASKENIEAKIFGGCNSLLGEDALFKAGLRNIEVAEHLLKQAGISITARSTGGVRGRKIMFNTRTGKVTVHMLKKTAIEMHEEADKGIDY